MLWTASTLSELQHSLSTLILEVSQSFLQLVQFTPQVPSTVYFYGTIQTQGNSKCFTRAFRMTQEDIWWSRPAVFWELVPDMCNDWTVTETNINCIVVWRVVKSRWLIHSVRNHPSKLICYFSRTSPWYVSNCRHLMSSDPHSRLYLSHASHCHWVREIPRYPSQPSGAIY